jgi:hypothetical protein
LIDVLGAEPVLYHSSSQRMEVIEPTHVFYEQAYAKFQTGFKMLWYKINGEKSWDENPFVWVITLKRVGCPKLAGNVKVFMKLWHLKNVRFN